MKRIIIFVVCLLFISATSVSKNDDAPNNNIYIYNDIKDTSIYDEMDNIIYKTESIIYSIKEIKQEMEILEDKNKIKLQELIYITNNLCKNE